MVISNSHLLLKYAGQSLNSNSYRAVQIKYPIIATLLACISAALASVYPVSINAATPTVNISGFWVLDEDLSDDPEPELKDIGKFKSRKHEKSDDEHRQGDKPVGKDTFRRYWEHVAENKEWRRVANAANKGSIKSLVFNKRLAIAATDSGFKVWYQDGFVRDINPNPYGRVFSASGDELVANDLGRTLSYVKKGKIISETRIEPRGDIFETFQPSSDQQRLEVTIKVDRPDWNKIVKLKQVYRRVADTETSEALGESEPVRP